MSPLQRDEIELFRAVFERHSAVMLLIDPLTGGILKANNSAATFYGYPRQVLETMNIVQINQLNEVEIKAEMNRAVTEQRNYFIFPHRLADGDLRTVEIHSSSVAVGERNILISIIHDITERVRAENQLSDYRNKLANLAAELSNAEERERRRISSNLHDHIGQTLALSSLKLSLAAFHLPTELAAELDEIKEMVDAAIEGIRSLTMEISPPILYETGLEGALEWLCRWFKSRYGIEARFVRKGRLPKESEEIRATIFQCVRELLINVAKHAETTHASVSVVAKGHVVSVEVKDEGKGFDLSGDSSQCSLSDTFGLFNVKRRIEHLDGAFAIESSVGAGTRVLITVPVPRER